jgi:hypothetical protein
MNGKMNFSAIILIEKTICKKLSSGNYQEKYNLMIENDVKNTVASLIM